MPQGSLLSLMEVRAPLTDEFFHGALVFAEGVWLPEERVLLRVSIQNGFKVYKGLEYLFVLGLDLASEVLYTFVKALEIPDVPKYDHRDLGVTQSVLGLL